MDQRDGVRVKTRYPVTLRSIESKIEYTADTLNLGRSGGLFTGTDCHPEVGMAFEVIYEDMSKRPLSRFRKKTVLRGHVLRLENERFVLKFLTDSDQSQEEINRLRLTAFNHKVQSTHGAPS